MAEFSEQLLLQRLCTLQQAQLDKLAEIHADLQETLRSQHRQYEIYEATCRSQSEAYDESCRRQAEAYQESQRKYQERMDRLPKLALWRMVVMAVMLGLIALSIVLRR